MLYFLNRWRASFIGTKFGDSGKKRNRKARAGKNSFPPTPFLFARPRRASGAIFFWGFIRPPAGLIFFFSFFLPFPFKIQHPDFLQKKFGFRPKGTAFLRLRRLSDYFSRLRRERPVRVARRKPARKGFATLRVAKKKCFGLELGSSTSKARIN
jgi:hypothetical protein